MCDLKTDVSDQYSSLESIVAQAQQIWKHEDKIREQEAKKYENVKRDLSFICRMVEENNKTMLFLIIEELIIHENYKYLDRECFSHNIQIAYILYYKKALKENTEDPLLEKIERFKKSVLTSDKPLVDDLLKYRGLLQLDAEFCRGMFIWLHKYYESVSNPNINFMLHCLKQSYKIDGYDGDESVNITRILTDKELLELVDIIVPTELDLLLWLEEVENRKLEFIDAIKSHAKISLVEQLIIVVCSERLHSNFIVDPYRKLVKNMIAIDDYQVRDLMKTSLDKKFTIFAEEYLNTINAKECDQIQFSSPFPYTLYELAYHRKNEEILKYCKPPRNFEQIKWRLGFLDASGDINLTITETNTEKMVKYSTNSEYSFRLIDIENNIARFGFTVVDSGFITLSAILGTIQLPSTVTEVKVQMMRISRY